MLSILLTAISPNYTPIIKYRKNRRGTFLKKLWCCFVVKYNKIIWFITVSLRRPTDIINPVDKTKLSCYRKKSLFSIPKKIFLLNK